jgi:hypothetical protein
VRLVKGLFAIGGVRRVKVDLDVNLVVPSQNTTLSGKMGPGLRDPLFGAQYRGRLTRRTRFDADVRAGGFGVGSDVDVSGEGAVNRQFAPHVERRPGYAFLYYKLTVDSVTISAVTRTLISKQTLHGPGFGLGIAF